MNKNATTGVLGAKNATLEQQAEDIVRAMVSESWNESIETIAGLLRQIESARKVADAAKDWADAFPGYEAGASGSGEYLRAREVLLRATVREYRALTESQEETNAR